MRRSHVILIIGVLAVFMGCATTPKAPSPAQVETMRMFEPATYLSQIQVEAGRYPDLFAPQSQAVWVGPEVAEIKEHMAEAGADGEGGGSTLGGEGEPHYAQIAESVVMNCIVIECHVESVFPDSSIAYDVVGFRGIDVYLLTPSGEKLMPIQTVVDSHASEEQAGALKRFGRTNLVVFPKRDLWLGEPVLGPDVPSVRLVLEGHDSVFYFEWPAAPQQLTTSEQQLEVIKSAAQQAAEKSRLGFRAMFRRLQDVAHVFD
jgi:hypothetical protein